MLIAKCPACQKTEEIVKCSNWRGWEYDKRKQMAFGMCETCKTIFRYYDGSKRIENMIEEHQLNQIDIQIIVCKNNESEESQ